VADEPAPAATRRKAAVAVRYVIGVAVGVVVLLLLVGRRGELVAASHRLSGVDIGWLVAAILAEALSLWSFAYLQHRVLRLSGASIPMPGLVLLALANDAIANTVPGEPAVSSAYRYRYYRRSGASGASAGWTIFTMLIAQAIGMSALLLVGVVVALSGAAGGKNAGVAVVGLVIICGAGAILVRRDLVLRLAGALVRAARRVTRRPEGGLAARVEATLQRMRHIPLTRRSAVAVVAIATWVWFADFICLACSFGAVHAPIPWDGALLAYGVAQVAGSLPFIPGGIGIVEGSLTVILAAYGARWVPALSATLAYRVVSFWLAIAVGWVSFGAIACLARRRGEGYHVAGSVICEPTQEQKL